MLQMQYNAPKGIFVFQTFFGGDTPNPLFVLRPRIGSLPFQNPGCAPGRMMFPFKPSGCLECCRRLNQVGVFSAVLT